VRHRSGAAQALREMIGARDDGALVRALLKVAA